MYSILVIEDDPSYLKMMQIILQMEGFKVQTASSGTSGLAQLREHGSDLILCDIMMPKMDGHCVFNTVKEDRRLAEIPFIFVTAMAERIDLRRGMSSGADDYLTKPFSADELVAAVNGRIRRKKMDISDQDRRMQQKKLTVLRDKVTAREREVLCMVGQGATSREIAERLGISVKTVEVHRSNLMKKLLATNAASLARWAAIAEQL